MKNTVQIAKELQFFATLDVRLNVVTYLNIYLWSGTGLKTPILYYIQRGERTLFYLFKFLKQIVVNTFPRESLSPKYIFYRALGSTANIKK